MCSVPVIGVFCRPNHPRGYAAWPANLSGPELDEIRNQPLAQAAGHLGAHGYVTWLVLCQDWVELNAVRDILRQGSEWDQRGDEWYSGPLDFVCAYAGSVSGVLNHNASPVAGNRWESLGDNRAFAMVNADVVLNMKPTRAGGFRCHAGKDGECHWVMCPQLRDGEPEATHRHCPLDAASDYEER